MVSEESHFHANDLLGELSHEEIEERIKRTEENPWYQLYKLGAEEWNTVMYWLSAEKNNILHNLPDEFDQYLKNKISVPLTKNHKLYSVYEKIKLENKIDFSGCYFQEYLSFKNFIFTLPVDFTRSQFTMGLFIFNCYFGSLVNFNLGLDSNFSIFHSFLQISSSVFCQGVDLNKIRFLRDVEFYNLAIKRKFQCIGSTFERSFKATNLTCSGGLCLNDSSFNKSVDFQDGSFKSLQFINVIFKEQVNFKSCLFNEDVKFKNTKFIFSPEGEFLTPNFIGTKFKTIADFTGAKFASVPHFEGAEIEAIFLKDSVIEQNENKDPQIEKSAWLALIRLMDKVHDFNRKQEFHLKLLEIERKEENGLGNKIIYFIYEALGSGREFVKPLLVWIFITVLSFLLYWLIICLSIYCPERYCDFNDLINITFSNAIPFNDFGEDQFLKNIKDPLLHFIWILLSSIHTVLSSTCLFLIGLAIRNRLRIKS